MSYHFFWKEKLEEELEGKSLSMDELAELKKLRKENKNLRMEKEILKKASAFAMPSGALREK